MRILIAHNHYGSSAPSGENEVVRVESELLARHGHEVEFFERHSDEIRLSPSMFNKVRGALATPWNPFEASRLRAVLQRLRPDILHVHNTFPLLSPAVFHAARGLATRVLTLHNYRLQCAAALPVRSGAICTDCIDRISVRPALQHGCYRGSRLATLPIAAGIVLHRALGTWQSQVEALIALTPFQRSLMVAGGLPADRMEVKPNFYPGEPPVEPWDDRAPRCLYAGRLSAEKGPTKLIDAWRAWGPSAPELLIVGDGPLRAGMERAASGLNISFTGALPPAETQRLIAQSRLLLIPSEWFEGFPMALREAFALGTAVAASRIGPLPSLLGDGRCGLLFDPFDAMDLLRVVRAAWEDGTRIREFAEAGRREFLGKYNEEANYAELMAIYERAIVRRKEGA